MEFEYNDNISVSNEENCVICGNPIDFDSQKHHPLLEKLIEENPNKCENCLEKIYTLKAYMEIKKHIPVKAGEYDKISQEFDDKTLNYYFSILKKYNLIKSFNHDVFFLKDEDDFYETENYKKYSQFLEEIFKEGLKEEHKFNDLELIIQEEMESNNNMNVNVDLMADDAEKDSNDENALNESNNQFETIIAENRDIVEDNGELKEEVLEEPVEETLSPPTVKHISISNLLHKKEPKDSKIDNTKKSLENTSKNSNYESLEETQKEVEENKVTISPPTVKRISISNLLHNKDKSEIKEFNNFKEESVEKLPETELLDNDISESKKEEYVTVDDKKPQNKLINDTEVVDEFYETSNSEENGSFVSEDINQKSIIKENGPKIPPKKSNGQYSLHKGISYKIGVYKWTADIREKGKLKSLGLFDTEEEAYQARQEYIRKKNPNKKDSKVPPKKSNNRFSLHDRVDYDLTKGKWFAYVNEYGVDKFLGYFNTEKEAYSNQCKYLNIYVPSKQKNGQYSLHNGVSFNKRYRKWTSTIRSRKKNRFLGYFCSELDALKAIELYEESNGKILNIWNPPKELLEEVNFDSNKIKFVKTFAYEPVDDSCMQVTLNGQIKDDKELFEILYKLNSFFINIHNLEIKAMDDFISLRASFTIKGDVLNKLILVLKESGWVK